MRTFGTEQRQSIRDALGNLGLCIDGLSDERLAALYKRYYFSDADWDAEECAESGEEIL